MFWLVWLGIGLYGMIPIVIFVLTLKIYIKNVETEKRIKKIMNGICILSNKKWWCITVSQKDSMMDDGKNIGRKDEWYMIIGVDKAQKSRKNIILNTTC